MFNPCKFILEIILALGDGENKILVLRQEAGQREIFQLQLSLSEIFQNRSICGDKYTYWFCNGLFKVTLLFPGPHQHLFKFPSHLSLEQKAPRLGEFVRQKTA